MGDGVLARRQRRIGIDVDRHHLGGAGARRRQRDDAGPGADIEHGAAAQIELRDEAGEIFAGDEVARMKDGRPHGEAKAVGAHGPGAAAVEHEIVGHEMDGAAKSAARQVGRSTGADGTAPRVLETLLPLLARPPTQLTAPIAAAFGRRVKRSRTVVGQSGACNGVAGAERVRIQKEESPGSGTRGFPFQPPEEFFGLSQPYSASRPSQFRSRQNWWTEMQFAARVTFKSRILPHWGKSSANGGIGGLGERKSSRLGLKSSRCWSL